MISDQNFSDLFTCSYHLYHSRWLRLAHRIIPSDSEDVVSSSLLRAWSHRHQYRGTFTPSALSSWILTIIFNCSLRRLRQDKAHQKVDNTIVLHGGEEVSYLDVLTSVTPTCEDDLFTRQLHSILTRQINRLTPNQKLVMQLEWNGEPTSEYKACRHRAVVRLRKVPQLRRIATSIGAL